MLIQKKTPIGPNDTLGTVYFDRLFPMGVDAMLESVDLVKANKAPRIKQDEAKATYEGRCTPENAKIDWGKPWEQIDRLIRGCNPAPGAWTTLDGKQLKIFDAKPLPAKDPKGIAGKLGEIAAVDADGFTVVCADGRFKVTRVQPADGKKIEAGEWAKSANLAVEDTIYVNHELRTETTCRIHFSSNGSNNARLATSVAEIRHRNLAGRQEAAHSRHRRANGSASRRKISSPMATTRPRCRWTTSSRCRGSPTAS